ncbi:hypothetical protein CPB85DRAFT_143670 [Mucidula mucida]|nr:hypothetical protein CPB85DRAFT_143670 [Mucidula mucida]
MPLSYPHPLDITLCIPSNEERFSEDIVIITDAVKLLRTHSLRWRSFSCEGPASFFNQLPIFSTVEELRLLRRLEKLDLVLIPEDPFTASPASDLSRISNIKYIAPPSLRHLRITFPFPHLNATWMNVTSFTGGFDSHQHFYDVLSHLDTLEILHLTHLYPLTIPPRRSVALSGLRHLKLSRCAIVELSTIAAYFRCPALRALSLVGGLHIHHVTQSCDKGEKLTAAMATGLFDILEQSKVALQELNVDLGVSVGSPFHERLFTAVSETVRTLRICSSFASKSLELEALLDQLSYEDNSQVLFPMLHELKLVADKGVSDALFRGPVLNAMERLIASRWEARAKVDFPRLQKLYLQRSQILDDYEEEAYISPVIGSSLALALLKYRLEGLDVEWLDIYYYPAMDLTVDVLEKTRSYVPAVL